MVKKFSYLSFTACVLGSAVLTGCSPASVTESAVEKVQEVQGDMLTVNLQMVGSTISRGISDGSLVPSSQPYGAVGEITTMSGMQDFSSYGFSGSWDSATGMICLEGQGTDGRVYSFTGFTVVEASCS